MGSDRELSKSLHQAKKCAKALGLRWKMLYPMGMPEASFPVFSGDVGEVSESEK